MTLATYPILSLRGVRPSFLRPQITGGAEWKKKKKKKKTLSGQGTAPAHLFYHVMYERGWLLLYITFLASRAQKKKIERPR